MTDQLRQNVPGTIQPFIGIVPNQAVDAINSLVADINAAAAAPSLVASITASQISTSQSLPSMFMTSGYAAAGDLGAGAIYTSRGASSTGPKAVQSADGVWFQLVLNGPINVGWFGAKGDGVADDRAAIQSALDYIAGLNGGVTNSGGGTLDLPTPSVFYNLVAGGISVNNGHISLRGGSQGTRIHYTGTASIAAVVLTSGAWQSLHFSNLFIKGNANSTYALELIGVGRSKLDNIQVSGAANGIHIKQTVCISTHNLRVGSLGNGIVFDGPWGTTASSFYNTIIESCPGVGLTLINVQRAIFVGGTSELVGTGLTIQTVVQSGYQVGEDNVFIGIHFEANSVADANIATGNNTFIACNSTGLFQISGGIGNRLINHMTGSSSVIQVDAAAISTVLDRVTLNGTTNDNGTFTQKANPSSNINATSIGPNANYNGTAYDIFSGMATKLLFLVGQPAGARLFFLPTMANMVTALGTGTIVPGQSWMLRILNLGGQTWTISPATGWSLSGTLTIATGTYRDFLMKFNGPASGLMQDMGAGTITAFTFPVGSYNPAPLELFRQALPFVASLTEMAQQRPQQNMLSLGVPV